MPATPSTKYAIPRPADADFINTWPATQRSAIDALDVLIATAITTMPRPAAGKFGRLHRATDGTISFDTGTTWEEIARTVSIAQIPLGAIVATASTVLPSDGRWGWADGGLIDGTVYTQFLSEVGHAYNLGVNPGNDGSGHQQVRKPDARERVRMGASTMGGGLAPSPRRVTVANVARGQNGGKERVLLLAAEGAQNGNAVTITENANHNHAYAAAVTVATISGGDVQNVADAVGSNTGVENQTHIHGMSARNADTAHENMQPYETDNYLVRIA